ncbi:hypothetical protein PEC18_00285 [Paucibacter sp. O1-1]|nr:hypothetical protein [Paucibacter sp. O1-1]MDA3824355.1 hypothetical protein [Paucibacter sp. O1-1]
MPQRLPQAQPQRLPLQIAAALALATLAGCTSLPEAVLPDYPAPAPGQPWARLSLRAAVPGMTASRCGCWPTRRNASRPSA